AMVNFGLNVAQAAATLAVVLVAFDAGIFGEEIMNGTIIMIAVTCFVAPLVTEKYGRRLAQKQAEEKAAEAPDQRIMIAVQDEESLSNLLGVSFLIRDADSEEALLPITVVHEDEEVPERLADAEKLLESFVEEGAGAEIPVSPITRMSNDRADEIVRAAVERRVSHVIVGLPTTPNGSDGVGPVAEELLERTNAQVAVCRLQAPINTVERAVVVFGPGIADHEGFDDSLEMLVKLCREVGANLTGLTREDERERIEKLYEEFDTDIPAEFEGIADDNLWERLLDDVKKTDMVVILGDRPSTDGWSPLSERLLDEIDELASQDIMFLFPPRPDETPPEVVELPTELSTPQWPSRRLRRVGRETDGVTS
ncbi:MAG: hypothetical protein ACOCV2_14185, partial [Persicimonas sp.]